MAKQRMYCTCGAAWGFDNSVMRLLWDELHTGDGHGPTDQRTAAKARDEASRIQPNTGGTDD